LKLGWRAKTLSQSEKSILIKAMALTIPYDAMSSFLLPSSLSSKFDNLFKDFWWGFLKRKTKNLFTKSGSSICLSGSLGSVSSRPMKEVNKNLVSKLGWKILTNHDSLWVAQVRAKYLRTGDFLSSTTTANNSSLEGHLED